MSPRRPDRLAWPEVKRPRRVTFLSNGEGGRSASLHKKNRLWTDKYVPQSSNDLAVAPKKVKEVSSWLRKPSGRLLILVGSPGIGKSTMVQCLAKEQKINLAEWTETTADNGIRSFEAFLQHASLLSELRSIILVDEIPNLYGNEVKFRELFSQHVRTGAVPTVLVVSDTIEGRSNALDQIIDPPTLYDTSVVQIIQIHPPTKARFKRALKRFSSTGAANNNKDDDLFDKTGGDLRYALCMLQSGCRPHFRDTKLSAFHALGKLLYAKRTRTGDLDFDPEIVMSSMDSASRALSFLQYHSLGFYTSMADIAKAMDSFSDASIMTFGRDSVAARTVAATNRNPAMTKFKQLSAPPPTVPNNDILSLRSVRPMLPLTVLATDIVPFLRRIDPQLCLNHSTFSRDAGHANKLEVERERKLLANDDILEDSDTE